MGHPYHELSAIQRRLSATVLIELTNDEPDGDSVDEVVYAEERERADSEIDAYAGARYQIPFETVPEVVARLSLDLTTVYLYARRYPEGVPEGIGKMGERAVALLRDISKGTVTLGVQPTPTENSQRTARLSSQTRVMTRDSLKSW